MSSEKNKAALLRWIDALNKKDLSALDKMADELFTADYISHPGAPGAERGPEGVKKGVHQVFKDNPDMHHTLEDMIAEGDKVASRISFRFTDTVSGKPANFLAIGISRFVGEKIAEEWELSVPGQW